MPSFYTKQVFNETTGYWQAPLVKQFAEETWVWGAGAQSAASVAQTHVAGYRALRTRLQPLLGRFVERPRDRPVLDRPAASDELHDPGRDRLCCPRPAEDGRRANVTRDGCCRYDGRGTGWPLRQPREARTTSSTRRRRKSPGPGPRAGHGDHAALRAHSSLHGGSARRRSTRRSSRFARFAISWSRSARRWAAPTR